MNKLVLSAILVVFLLALFVLPARSQGVDQAEGTVRVAVRYDPDYDGVNQSVGPGRITEARKGGVVFAISQTNEDGVSSFILPYGVYEFSTWVRSTRFFYYWECLVFDVVDEPTESFLTICKERFFLRLPFSSAGTAVE